MGNDRSFDQPDRNFSMSNRDSYHRPQCGIAKDIGKAIVYGTLYDLGKGYLKKNGAEMMKRGNKQMEDMYGTDPLYENAPKGNLLETAKYFAEHQYMYNDDVI